jgi:hypothetical protein
LCIASMGNIEQFIDKKITYGKYGKTSAGSRKKFEQHQRAILSCRPYRCPTGAICRADQPRKNPCRGLGSGLHVSLPGKSMSVANGRQR